MRHRSTLLNRQTHFQKSVLTLPTIAQYGARLLPRSSSPALRRSSASPHQRSTFLVIALSSDRALQRSSAWPLRQGRFRRLAYLILADSSTRPLRPTASMALRLWLVQMLGSCTHQPKHSFAPRLGLSQMLGRSRTRQPTCSAALTLGLYGARLLLRSGSPAFSLFCQTQQRILV